MELPKLKEGVKGMALDSGAVLAGVGSRERLAKAPPSADMDYSLPGAQSCIIWAYAVPYDVLKNYFGKVERMGMKKFEHHAYSVGWETAKRIAQYLECNSDFKAVPLAPNGVYRGAGGKNIGVDQILKVERATPPFSLRYGAVAAGLGHLGWSGNLVTERYGGALFLGGVLTTAPLEPDPIPQKNHCDHCKLCTQVCTTGFFSSSESEQPVAIGGVEEIYSKRNAQLRCVIGCAGFTGLSRDGTWSTWTPGHVCLAAMPERRMKGRFAKYRILLPLFFSPRVPAVQRRFNKKIREEFRVAGDIENFGQRPADTINPRCGLCSLICVADPVQRRELFDLLRTSGKVYLDRQGREVVRRKAATGELIEHIPPLQPGTNSSKRNE